MFQVIKSSDIRTARGGSGIEGRTGVLYQDDATGNCYIWSPGSGVMVAVGSGGSDYADIVPAAGYLFAYRGSQGDFGYLKDQSGKFNDAALNAALYPQAWAANTAYAVGAYRSPTTINGWLYKVTAATAVPAAGAEPNWPTVAGQTVTDASGNTFTCEKGPFYIDATTGRRHARTIASTQLGASGGMRLVATDFDCANGDSFIMRIAGACNFAGGDERTIFSNRGVTGAANGIALVASQAYKDLRIGINVGGATLQTGHLKAGAARPPLDGAYHDTVFMYDGPTKRLYAYTDAIAYTQADMFDANNLAPNDFDYAALGAGSCGSALPLTFGCRPTAAGALDGTSYELGIAAFDFIVLKKRGLPANLQAIASFFASRGTQPLPASYVA